MIVGNLATYPPRRETLLSAVTAVSSQVDVLHVILNEYEDTLPELDEIDSVIQILPQEDTKDVGKFLPEVFEAKYVLLFDDDLIYPGDYVSHTVALFESLGPTSCAAGYHGVIYEKPARSWFEFLSWRSNERKDLTWRRKVLHYKSALDKALIVDQIGTGTAIVRGSDFPAYDFMVGSQKFVDVRFALWCYMKEIRQVALPKPEGWLCSRTFEDTIYHNFTKTNPHHVNLEISKFALRRDAIGEEIELLDA